MVDFEKLYKNSKTESENDIKDIIKIIFGLATEKGLIQHIYSINKSNLSSDQIKLKVNDLSILVMFNGDYLTCKVNKIDLIEDIPIRQYKIYDEKLIEQFKYILKNNCIIEKINKERDNMRYISQVTRDLKDTFSFYDGLWRE